MLKILYKKSKIDYQVFYILCGKSVKEVLPMMVNSISSVRFCGPADTTAAKPEGSNFLDRPGAFAKPAAENPAPAQAEPKKKSSVGKKLLTLAGVAVAVAAALVAGNKTGVLKVLDEAAISDAGIFKKAGHYLAKAGEWVGKYTYEPIAKLFSKNTPSA